MDCFFVLIDKSTNKEKWREEIEESKTKEELDRLQSECDEVQNKISSVEKKWKEKGVSLSKENVDFMVSTLTRIIT